MSLSPEQEKAAFAFDKNVLLLAPAGTGKTFTVAHKVAEALKRGITPAEILCLTFTVKAQEEIKADVTAYCGETTVNVYTLHGFCYRLIKDYYSSEGVKTPFSVADEVDVGETTKRLADDMLKEKSDDPDEKTVLPEKQFSRIISEIKRRKDELGFSPYSPDGFGAAIATLLKNPDFCELFSTRKFGAKITDYNFFNLIKNRGAEFMTRYRDAFFSSDLLDFDDLIYMAKDIVFRGDADLNAYKLIILDEVQDTGKTEYEIVRKFFTHATIMLCGDENQTIYGWRGSAPEEIINDFKQNFNAEEIRLTANRRSGKFLQNAARGYLSAAFGSAAPPPEITDETDEKITILKCGDETDEARKIYDIVKNYSGDRTNICIMARSNRYLAALYNKFTQINRTLPVTERIPFFTANADYQFYKKPVVKDFLAFLRLTVNPSDAASMERVIKRRLKRVKTGLASALSDYGTAGVSVSDFLNPDVYRYGDAFYKLIKAYNEDRIVCYDLETTGADPYDDEPIQISAVKFGKGGESAEFNLFVMPDKEISAGALSTHGYDKKYIATHGGVSINEAITRFSLFSDGCVLVGHNSSQFDDIMLMKNVKKCGKEINADGFFDTLKIAKTFFKAEKNYKLATLCEKFGVINERAHDAFADVTATEKILKILLDEYIIPSAAVRQSVIIANREAFKPLCDDVNRFKAEIERGDIRGAITDIASSYSLIKPDSPVEDRESANDLYVALRCVENTEKPLDALSELLANVALSGSQMDLVIKKLKKVPLITVHQSKGCEFDEVIFAGASENEIPSYPARASGDETEEKRVFYVALTRAKRKLIITYPSKKIYGQTEYERAPSPYLDYLPRDCLEVK